MTPTGPGQLPTSPAAGPVAELSEELPPAPIGRRGRLAGAIADAAATIPGVVLTARRGVATQYAGGTVAGVGLGDGVVTVQIVAGTVPLQPLVDAVHQAAALVLAQADDHRRLHVHVADLDLTGRLSGSKR